MGIVRIFTTNSYKWNKLIKLFVALHAKNEKRERRKMNKFRFNLQLFAEPEPIPAEPTPTPAPKGNMIPQSRLNDVIAERDGFKTSLSQKESEITALNEKLNAYEGYIPPTELEKVKTETEKTYQEKMEALTVS